MKPTELRTVSVIIPAYTLARWELLSDAVARLQSQTRLPDEIILCIDHNPELYDLCLREPVFCHEPFRYESCMTRVTVASPPLTSTNELTGPDVGSAQAPPATLLLGRLLAIFYSFKMMMRLPIQIGSQRLSTSTTTPAS